jgi:hypothetical protein
MKWALSMLPRLQDHPDSKSLKDRQMKILFSKYWNEAVNQSIN